MHRFADLCRERGVGLGIVLVPDAAVPLGDDYPYRFMHDQTLRFANHGLTAPEIAETLALPPEFLAHGHTRGYYGDLVHNTKAVYQRYLSWYDGNPARLHTHPPVEAKTEIRLITPRFYGQSTDGRSFMITARSAIRHSGTACPGLTSTSGGATTVSCRATTRSRT